MTTPAATIQDIDNIYQFLSAQQNLGPAPQVNRAFTRLVRASTTPFSAAQSAHILGELEQRIGLEALHRLCAQGEYAMEWWWGNRIRTSATPLATAKSFTYWENYRKLAKLEVSALRRAVPNLKNVLFVGSGPLPLTAYFMATSHKLAVTNLDTDSNATNCATHWMVKSLGLSNVNCLHVDALNYKAYANHDVVAMAALVGLNASEKSRILAHLHRHMRPGQVLMVRSAKGLRTLLYPKVEETLPGFTLLRAIHPRGEVINSVLLFKRD